MNHRITAEYVKYGSGIALYRFKCAAVPQYIAEDADSYPVACRSVTDILKSNPTWAKCRLETHRFPPDPKPKGR